MMQMLLAIAAAGEATTGGPAVLALSFVPGVTSAMPHYNVALLLKGPANG